MLRCARCETENPAGFHFCGGCGASPATLDRPQCGAPVPAVQRFCGTCGAMMAAAGQVSPVAGAGAGGASPAATADLQRLCIAGLLRERERGTVEIVDPLRMEEGLAWARELGDPTRERYGLQSLAWHHVLRAFLGGPGDITVAIDHAAALAAASASMDDPIGAAYGLSIAAILRRGAGDLEGSAERAQAALDLDPGADAAPASGGISGLLLLRALSLAGEPGAAEGLDAAAAGLRARGALLALPARQSLA